MVDTDKGYKYAPKQLTTEEDIEEAASKRRYEERRTKNMQKENMARTLLTQHKRMIKYRTKTMEFEDVEGRRPSIDRIDSNKGYTRDNVVITLGVVNLMKRDLKINEFIELCSQVVNHFNNK